MTDDWRAVAHESYPKLGELPQQPRCKCGELAVVKCKGCRRYFCERHARRHPEVSDSCAVKQLEAV